MRSVQTPLAVLIVSLLHVFPLQAAEPEPALENVKAAIARAIPLLEAGSRGSADQRTCFTCHNQALPILALTEARTHGFSVDADNLDRQIRHTADHLTRGREEYRKGRGQGGKVITAGYALWALEAGGWKPEETTDAVVEYLLEYQKDADCWSHPGKRPPSTGSDFTASYVALRGLSAFGTEEQQSRIDARTDTVTGWLLSNNPADTEDRVFRLLALSHVDAGERAVNEAARELIAGRRNDGGWAQTTNRESDAYATGTVLVALLRTGRASRDDPVVRRGVQYLINTQFDDGSWHVVTRAEPFQTYYESGFPHGSDQFISIAASSWAALALLRSLPEPP